MEIWKFGHKFSYCIAFMMEKFQHSRCDWRYSGWANLSVTVMCLRLDVKILTKSWIFCHKNWLKIGFCTHTHTHMQYFSGRPIFSVCQNWFWLKLLMSKKTLFCTKNNVLTAMTCVLHTQWTISRSSWPTKNHDIYDISCKTCVTESTISWIRWIVMGYWMLQTQLIAWHQLVALVMWHLQR